MGCAIHANTIQLKVKGKVILQHSISSSILDPKQNSKQSVRFCFVSYCLIYLYHILVRFIASGYLDTGKNSIFASSVCPPIMPFQFYWFFFPFLKSIDLCCVMKKLEWYDITNFYSLCWTFHLYQLMLCFNSY